MRRDMEFVRELLIDFSEGKRKGNFITSGFGGETPEMVDNQKFAYHLKIMEQEGLITSKTQGYKGGFLLMNAPELTWKGQDYLSAIEDDTIWNKTKEAIKSQGLEIGKMATSTIYELAKLKAKEILGIGN